MASTENKIVDYWSRAEQQLVSENKNIPGVNQPGIPNSGVATPLANNAGTSGTTVTTDDLSWIKVLDNASQYFTIYDLTGVFEYDADSNPIAFTADLGVFTSSGIKYESGNFVNKVTGLVTFSNGQIAYKNKPNTFTGVNTFVGTGIHKSTETFPFYGITLSGVSIGFDGANGQSQYVEITDTGAYTLDFSNIVDGCTYYLICDVTYSPSVSINKGTITDSGFIDTNYSIGGKTYPATLETGVHWFVFGTGNTGIHWSYLGKSTAF